MLTQVLFRHGARTPLTRRYWEGSVWEDCGDAYGHAVAALRGEEHRSSTVDLPKMNVFDKHTQKPQVTCIDGENLVHYPGGCTRGELTKVGQRQVCTTCRSAYRMLSPGHQTCIRTFTHGSPRVIYACVTFLSSRMTRKGPTEAGVGQPMLRLHPDLPSADLDVAVSAPCTRTSIHTNAVACMRYKPSQPARGT